MKKLLTLALMAISIAASAQTKVVDETGAPLIGAVVLNSSGTLLGIVDKNGLMPEIAPESYPVILRCLGFENTSISQPTDQIVMKETAYALGEVTIKPGERPACHVVCYIRETSGMMNEEDTVRVVAQYMADFMLKDDPKAKGFPTWSSPRQLNREIEQHTASGKELDKYEFSVLSWYDILGRLEDGNVGVPGELRGQTSGSVTRKSKKLGNDAVICQISPSQYSVFVDGLADREGHTWSPGFFKLIGATTDINELWSKMTFNYNADEVYDVRNLVARTYSMKFLGRGKIYRSIFGAKSPVQITDYIEIYPVAIEYLTRDEAKALKKEKKTTYPMTKPARAK